MSFPNRIRVKGLPFMLQGWNSTYYKTTDTSDGCPVYRLDEYALYWTIQIAAVIIYRENGVWRLRRVDCEWTGDIKKYGQTPQGDPFGYWSSNMQVLPA